MDKENRYVASVSFGKDSVWMLYWILMHPEKYPLHHVVFVNTGMEFVEAINTVKSHVVKMLQKKEIPFTEIDISEEFYFNMMEREVCKKGTEQVHRQGYGWCGGVCRWGTSMKLQALNRFYHNTYPSKKYVVYEYVGFASDEEWRIPAERDPYKIYPLVDAGITEKESLINCYRRGVYWEMNGIKMYEILDRLSCWCCRNKNLKELKEIFYCLPDYWERLKKLERLIGEPMKGEGMGLVALERRFCREGYAQTIFDWYDFPESLEAVQDEF